MTFPAFKEWSVIVEALGAGEQIIILRKGGISEGPAGFQVSASRFWLFPTLFHAQLEKTKPTAARWFGPAEPRSSSPASTVELRYFADLVESRFLGDWTSVERLDPHHFWTQETIRERFMWDRPPGLYVLIVRVYKLAAPIVLPLTPDMGGCKSWVTLPCPFTDQPSAPVIADGLFAQHVAALSV